ncbi:MAG: phage regulatory protein/antirepressor Ant, partial [Burkholderiaceae bacterium]|nr:phage regulatory protein/antirepressor Ant [Burkholderiaceae bacterium]
MNIVTLQSGQPVATSLAIASGTENDHASVIKLVRTYQSDLEDFGRVGFEIQPFETAGGKQEREIAILNEQQSTLLLTYMRNSDIVRQFKKALVKAFYELKQAPTINPAELSRMQLIQMAMQAEQERIVLEQKVEILEPKAEALDRFATFTDGSFCIRDAAKTL